MKKVLYIFIVIILLILFGCSVKQSGISTNNLKVENLRFSHYINGLVWQDQIENSSKKVSLDEAERYCEDLDLLNMKGWRLPIIQEVESLNIKDYKKFKYQVMDAYYHTSSHICNNIDYVTTSISVPVNILIKTLSKVAPTYKDGKRVYDVNILDECQYEINEKKINKLILNKPAYFRCVLDGKKFKKQRQKQLNKIKELRKINTTESYLNAFKLSNDISDLEKANKLARSDEEKFEVEKSLVKYIEPSKLVKLYISKTKDKKDLENVKSGDVLKIFSYTTSNKEIELQTQVSSEFLKYGDYVVEVNYSLEYSYNASLGFFGMSGKKKVDRIAKYVLNRENGYHDTKSIKFKIISSIHTGLGSIEINNLNVKGKIIKIENR